MTRPYGSFKYITYENDFTAMSGVFDLSALAYAIRGGFWAIPSRVVIEVHRTSGLWTAPEGVTEIEYLIVGGGGGSGSANFGVGGGGGGGGFRTGIVSVTPGSQYPVVVGAGGSGGGRNCCGRTRGYNGGISCFNTIRSAGGGGGGNFTPHSEPTPNDAWGKGGCGGSGGGSGYQPCANVMPGGVGNCPFVTPAQGCDGGAGSPNPQRYGGSGGGANQAGCQNSQSCIYPGGCGQASSLCGVTTHYSGGGGVGGIQTAPLAIVYGSCGGCGGGGNGGWGCGTFNEEFPEVFGNAGVIHTGGGGGSPGWLPGPIPYGGNESCFFYGFAGGSGIVIIKYTMPLLEGIVKEFAGSQVWTVPTGVNRVDYVIVGGGGGGGAHYGGGGGAGGYIEGTCHPVTPGCAMLVCIGAGASARHDNYHANSGANTTFDNLIAFGGGGGGSHQHFHAQWAGGSGGGATGHGLPGPLQGCCSYFAGCGNIFGCTPAQGYPGYNHNYDCGTTAAGGGGGANQGGPRSSPRLNGGCGIASNITGNTVFYAGGGGGAYRCHYHAGRGGCGGGGNGASQCGCVTHGWPWCHHGSSGDANRGGGGGATGHDHSRTGGSGTVIIKMYTDDGV